MIGNMRRTKLRICFVRRLSQSAGACCFGIIPIETCYHRDQYSDRVGILYLYALRQSMDTATLGKHLYMDLQRDALVSVAVHGFVSLAAQDQCVLLISSDFSRDRDRAEVGAEADLV